MQIRAFSKINLILEVLSKRPDGYHEIRSVMQSLALHDMVTVSACEDCVTLPALAKLSPLSPKSSQLGVRDADSANFLLLCSDPTLPTDDRNLVTRAAKYMMREYGITQPVSIHLEKRIPVAAGLAGGSSDCAATLLGLNQLFGLNIPLHSTTQASLMQIGRRFGADVPFCLMACAGKDDASTKCGATALAEGIGEKLTPLTPHPHVWIVLACQDIRVSTADIFGRFKALDAAANPDTNYLNIVQALTQGDLHKIATNFKNDLTQVAVKLHPEIQNIINEMENQSAIGAAMSGSGPTVFGYFNSKEQAEKAQEKLQRIVGRTFLTHI